MAHFPMISLPPSKDGRWLLSLQIGWLEPSVSLLTGCCQRSLYIKGFNNQGFWGEYGRYQSLSGGLYVMQFNIDCDVRIVFEFTPTHHIVLKQITPALSLAFATTSSCAIALMAILRVENNELENTSLRFMSSWVKYPPNQFTFKT